MKNRRDFLKTLSTSAAATVIGSVCINGYSNPLTSPMKELIVKKVNTTADAPWDEVLKLLETTAKWNVIDTVNWSEYTYCPKVEFRMAYADSALLLQYRVKEQSVRAVAAADNGEVWKDSCVEMFIKPENDDLYYNFEFNCIGMCLLAVGASRNNREMAKTEILSKIRRKTSLDRKPFGERKGETEWDLTAVIPYACFFQHPHYSPGGKTAHVNFYKCGDDLTVPHFLSWNPIKAEKPDFHRPECFGKLKFEL
jgi:hypothetical protein